MRWGFLRRALGLSSQPSLSARGQRANTFAGIGFSAAFLLLAMGGYLIAPLLDQDVEYDAVLVNGSPQPVAFAANLQRHFVQMPLVAGSHLSSTQPCRKWGPNLVHHWRMVSWLTLMPRSVRRS